MKEVRPMGRLSKMNGWQRLWFIGTVFALIIFALIYPVANGFNGREDYFAAGIGADYGTPACAPYINEPFDLFMNPKYSNGGTCWFIYQERKRENGNPAPQNYSDWKMHDDKRRWLFVPVLSGILVIIVLFGSALVYGFGAIVAWIVKGFRPSSITK